MAAGIIDVPSPKSVDDTVAALQRALEARSVNLFAIIDHGGEALKAGFAMRPTKLLIFGTPRAGTPMMLAAPTIAIDLPLKVLVWEDGDGRVWMSYNSAAYLKERHQLPDDLAKPLAALEKLVALV